MHQHHHNETIYALASGQGPAGIAVIRLSGPDALLILEKLCHPVKPDRKACLARLRHPDNGSTLDQALVLGFQGPHSFTGEDVGEIHVHGGTAVIESVFVALSCFPGTRMAEPGEFSRRAFENGKMDLTEVEGLADLIAAETEAQKQQAIRQMQGELGALYNRWRDGLMQVQAHMEAVIDFAEEDIPEDLHRQAMGGLENLLSEMRQHLDDGKRGQRLRDGVSVVIVGPPNAGKSSLLNAIVKRDAAIVSAIPGTTRDVVDAHVILSGVPVTFSDTAGLRISDDEIETEGVRRALDRSQQADLIIVLLDGAVWPDVDEHTRKMIDVADMTVLNKSDILSNDSAPLPYLAFSVKTGNNFDVFMDRLEQGIHARAGASASPAITRERHRQCLMRCVDYMERGLALWTNQGGIELVAEDLRLASRQLGRITGRVDVEDLLDIIFADFCIGK